MVGASGRRGSKVWATIREGGVRRAGPALALLVGLGLVAACSVALPRLPRGSSVPVRVELRPRQAPTTAVPQAVIPPGLPSVHVPILEYHYIRVNPNPRDRLGFNLSVTPASFKAQMSWLSAHQYHAIDLADLRAYLAGQVYLPSRPVVLTFD